MQGRSTRGPKVGDRVLLTSDREAWYGIVEGMFEYLGTVQTVSRADKDRDGRYFFGIRGDSCDYTWTEECIDRFVDDETDEVPEPELSSDIELASFLGI